MKKEDLLFEIRKAVNVYNHECDMNYGHEGTSHSYAMRVVVETLIAMLNNYYHENFIFERRERS